MEAIVAPSVSARLGGMQPASISRVEMFGPKAPVWAFLRRFGGPADPLSPVSGTLVFETYPVLVLIALGWTLPAARTAGRLPKYNPQRTKAFSLEDWRHVCNSASATFFRLGLNEMSGWLEEAAAKPAPRKSDQDALDACLCLLVALHMGEGRDCLMVGDTLTGYIVGPYSPSLFAELVTRCRLIGRNPADCVRTFRPDQVIAPGNSRQDAIDETSVTKPHHLITPAERLAHPIANSEVEQKSLAIAATWNLPAIVVQLHKHRQRASYGAVAGLLGILPRGVMNGRPQSQEYSWVVAATGRQRGWPTGYTTEQIHPECLRQIREGSGGVIDSADQLRRWLVNRNM